MNLDIPTTLARLLVATVCLMLLARRKRIGAFLVRSCKQARESATPHDNSSNSPHRFLFVRSGFLRLVATAELDMAPLWEWTRNRSKNCLTYSIQLADRIKSWIINASQTSRTLPRGIHWLAIVIAVFLWAIVTAGFEHVEYTSMARNLVPDSSLWNRTVVWSCLVGKSLLLVLPGLLLSSAFLLWRKIRTAWAFASGTCALISAFIVTDLRIFAVTGNHLATYFQYAFEVKAMEWGGGDAGFVWTFIQPAILSSGGVLLLFWYFCRSLFPFVASRFVSRARFCVAVPTVLVLSAVMVPALLVSTLTDVFPVVWCLRQFPVTPPFFQEAIQQSIQNPLTDKLGKFREQFVDDILTGKPVDSSIEFADEDLPNVILILLESWRYDSIDARWMPRLHRLSQQGLRLTQHYSGSNCSCYGAYALLYGRHPIAYAATLDRNVPPQLNQTLRSNGYECHLFSSANNSWLRMEEYLSPRSFDKLVNRDTGPWPERDLNALRDILRLADSNRQPFFAMTYLMSTHFDYPYPPQYERFTPVAQTSVMIWDVFHKVVKSNPSSQAVRQSWLNRYRNALGFMDDAVCDLIDKIDLDRNIVIVTGDHGESFYDDGYWFHSSSLSDQQTRVPMVILGPNVPAKTISTRTAHIDVVPTVLSLLAGRHVEVAHTHGYDLLNSANARKSLLLLHLTKDSTDLELSFLVETSRVHLSLTKQPFLKTRLLHSYGFHNVNGDLLPPKHDQANAIEYADEIEEALSRISR